MVALALLLFERRKLLRRDRKLIIGRWEQRGAEVPHGVKGITMVIDCKNQMEQEHPICLG